ncbi:MAG TPA: hypothetical protein VGD55_03570, partial [Acidothermaceae bacterium]
HCRDHATARRGAPPVTSGPAGAMEAIVTLRFFGQVVIVDTREPSLADVVRALWRPFVSPADGSADAAAASPPVHLAVPHGGTRAEDLGWLNSTLNSTAMELTPHLAVHAGVVRRGDIVVAFPAHSGVGKSTLTGACLRAGFEYVSDESLCLSYENNWVHPYPRPIGLSAWSAQALDVDGVRAGDDVLVLPQDFGSTSTAIDESLRLTHVVLPRRIDKSAEPSSLAAAPAHEAIEALLRMSFNHYRRPVDAMRLVASVVADADLSVLTYSDARDAAALMAQAFPEVSAGGSPLVDELPHP